SQVTRNQDAHTVNPLDAKSDHELAADERLRVAIRGVTLDPAKPEDRTERLLREPTPIPLGGKRRQQVLHLGGDLFPRERDIEACRTKITVPLGNFILQDRAATEDLPHQLREETMILVRVVKPRTDD